MSNGGISPASQVCSCLHASATPDCMLAYLDIPTGALQGDVEALRAEINSLRASIKKGAEAA